MIWIPGEIVRTSHGAFRIVTSNSVSIFIGETVYILEISKPTNRFQQFKESLLALAADGIIHIICVENGSRIVGGEVASPKDRQMGESCSHFAAGGNGTNRLWSGHHRNRQKFHRPLFDQIDQRFGRLGIDVAVDDAI